MSKDNPLCALNIFFLGLSVCIGVFALYVHNNLLHYIYLALALCVIIAPKRYGKLDGPLLVSAWAILALFPLPFLLYYQDYLIAVIYIVTFWLWFVINSSSDCSNCKSSWCSIDMSKK
jgi:hypothetical protein